MRKKLRDYLAAIYSPALEPTLARLLSREAGHREGGRGHPQGQTRRPPRHPPTKWIYWNVHVDGLEYTHDLIVEREGVFKECVAAIKHGEAARLPGGDQHHGLQGNRRAGDRADVRVLLRRSKWTATPFRPATITTPPRRTWSSAWASKPEDFFLTREMTVKKFAKIQEWGEQFTIFGTPVYQEFLAGKRELTCTAWAIPTCNVKGWKAPCYLMTDGHYAALPGNARPRWTGTNTAWWTASRAIRAARTAWSTAATIPAARSARTTSAATTGRTSDTTSAPGPSRITRAARSTPSTASPSAKAISPKPRPRINNGLAGAKSAFQNNGHDEHGGGGCGSGDTSRAGRAAGQSARSEEALQDEDPASLSSSSFDGFDGGAGSRYQARREVTSFWYPTWLAQPAALVPNSKLLDCPPHDIRSKQCLAEAKDYDHVIIHTSHALAEERLQGGRSHQGASGPRPRSASSARTPRSCRPRR